MTIHFDLIIIYLFLILTFAIGIYYGRGIKTFQDYAVGNRKLSVMVIALSLIATCHGGKALSETLNNFCNRGFIACITYLSAPVAYYIACRFLMVRMQEFIGHCSIAESMGSIYGPTIRCFVAILCMMASITTLALQIKVGLNIATKLFPESASLCTWIVIGIVIIYATFGGARAVALTDVYQFLFFSLYCPMLLFVLLYYNQDLSTGWKSLTTIPYFNLKTVLTWNDTLKDALSSWFWGIFTCLCVQPEYAQRFYMSASIPKAVKAVKSNIIMRIMIVVLFLVIALFLQIAGIQPKQSVLDYMLNINYFPGMLGLLVTVIFALLMSTADSNLHAASVFFANDIWPVVKRGLTKQSFLAPSLQVARWASLAIGLLSLMVVFNTTSEVTSFLRKTYLPYKLAVGIPFIMTCLGFRPRPAALFLSMIISVILALYHTWYKSSLLPIPKTGLLLVSSPYYNLWGISFLSLLAAHYLFPKCSGRGWVGIPDHSLWDLQNQMTKRWWNTRLQQLILPFTQTYRWKVFPKERSTFVRLGVYLMVHAFIALCFIHKPYLFPHIYWYIAVMVIATVIAFYPAFHSYQRGGNQLLHWVWPFLLFSLLFVANLQFVKLSYGRPMVCALFVVSLGLAIVLLSLEISLIMFGITVLIHTYIPPYLPMFWTIFSSFTPLSREVLLSLILITLAVVGFSTYKYLRDRVRAKFKIMERTRTYAQRISLASIYHQASWSRLDITYGHQLLCEIDEKIKKQGSLKEEIPLLMHKLYQFNNALLKRVQAAPSLALNQHTIKEVRFKPVIEKVYRALQQSGEPTRLLLRIQTTVKALLADQELLKCLFMLNVLGMGECAQIEDHVVTLTIGATVLCYEGTLTMPALAFCISTDSGEQPFLSQYDVTLRENSLYLPKTAKQLYQIESKQIVEAHGGYVAIRETSAHLTCLYVLPIDGKKVMRFKTYHPTHLASGKVAVTTESVAQEKELITLLTGKTSLPGATIEKTIAFIRNAHGWVTRKSGEPYYTHPMAVAKILWEVTQDPITILSGLLHDVVEDTAITLNQIEMMYGQEVAAIVDKVTEYHTNGYPWKLEKAAQKAMLEACGDMRVIQIKLADRLHNIRTLYARKLKSQQRIARETLTFYIPWGKRNRGPEVWLTEMKQICQEVLQKRES